MSSFVIYTEIKKRTQLLYHLAIVGVKQTCICILSRQGIFYRMWGHCPVGSTYFGSLRDLLPHHSTSVPQYPKLWVKTVQRDEEQKM